MKHRREIDALKEKLKKQGLSEAEIKKRLDAIKQDTSDLKAGQSIMVKNQDGLKKGQADLTLGQGNLKKDTEALKAGQNYRNHLNEKSWWKKTKAPRPSHLKWYDCDDCPPSEKDSPK